MVARKTRTDEPVQAAPSVARPNENESLADLAQTAADTVDALEPAEAGKQLVIQQKEQDAATQSAVRELTEALQIARDIAAPLLEAMGTLPPGATVAIWSNDALAAIAGPVVAIMERHGVDLTEALERFGPYVGLVVGLWGPSAATFITIKQHAIAIKAGNDSKQQQQPA